MRNTVCNVSKFFRRKIIEIFENGMFDYLTVQCRYAVYTVTAVDRKVCHLDTVVFNYRHTGNLCPFSGELVPQFFAKSSVNFFYNRMYSRNRPFYKFFRPSFKRFGKNRVVCICAGCRSNRPSLIPIIEIFVNEYPH